MECWALGRQDPIRLIKQGTVLGGMGLGIKDA